MQTFRIPFTNFQFGEISPSMIGRTDAEVYNKSAQKLTNFFIRNEGGVIKRPGFKKKLNLGASAGTTDIGLRIIPFILSKFLTFFRSFGLIISEKTPRSLTLRAINLVT